MSMFMAIPRVAGTFVTVEVATGTAVKTVLQVGVPSTTDITVLGWGISFDGVSATAAPGVCELVDTNTVFATVTSLTPDKWGSEMSPSSLCVGGAALTGYNASAEGTITAARFIDGQNVHPQTGYSVWFPDRTGPQVQPSRSLRIRTTFAATVNCLPWIAWLEPAR
jgi:hypothetical protein